MTNYPVDNLDRLTKERTSGVVLYTYTYDSRGNLLTTSETGVVAAIAYDAASRLGIVRYQNNNAGPIRSLACGNAGPVCASWRVRYW